MFGQFMKIPTASSSSSGSLPSNTVPNPREDLKVITTRSGVTLAGPSVSPPPPPSSKEVDREPETITDQVLTGSTNNVPPLVVQPSFASTFYTPISFPKIPEVTKDMRANKQKLREKDDNLALKFVEIFRNLHFKLSFADALLHLPKFALMFKSLLNNKEKLFDLAMTSVNENCSAVILKKLPEKLGDPAGIAEDVLVKVGKFHFPTDFVVVDYVVDSRVPLILGRPFLRTGRDLIDVYGEELTLRVDDEALTFKVGQTLKYSYNDAESINRIDVIDVACEEYVQEV
nr:reverse transcriptase domain-containing protein [Tanacetum cinerariifolium]